MKIYTRKGDRGQTRLLSGDSVEKDDPRVMTYGALDELQCHLGFARSLTRVEAIASLLNRIQNDIFVAGSELASTPETLPGLKRRIAQDDVEVLEKRIDEYTAVYGLPGGFVIPGRSPDSAAVHVARAVCRRCERLIVMLNRRQDGGGVLLTYFNRLSDLLFAIAWALEVRAVVVRAVEELIGPYSGEISHP